MNEKDVYSIIQSLRQTARIKAVCSGTTEIDEYEWYVATMLEALYIESEARQAKIDELMFEYCPDEMSQEQIEEYERNQVCVSLDDIKIEKEE